MLGFSVFSVRANPRQPSIGGFSKKNTHIQQQYGSKLITFVSWSVCGDDGEAAQWSCFLLLLSLVIV